MSDGACGLSCLYQLYQLFLFHFENRNNNNGKWNWKSVVQLVQAAFSTTPVAQTLEIPCTGFCTSFLECVTAGTQLLFSQSDMSSIETLVILNGVRIFWIKIWIWNWIRSWIQLNKSLNVILILTRIGFCGKLNVIKWVVWESQSGPFEACMYMGIYRRTCLEWTRLWFTHVHKGEFHTFFLTEVRFGWVGGRAINISKVGLQI